MSQGTKSYSVKRSQAINHNRVANHAKRGKMKPGVAPNQSGLLRDPDSPHAVPR